MTPASRAHRSPAGLRTAAQVDQAARRARAAFVAACRLDVLVCKPGNVSAASPGHGMTATQFIASAEAAAAPLFAVGASVGERIERAAAASWAHAGCNTNLGIVLLCAPLAAAHERRGMHAAAAQERRGAGASAAHQRRAVPAAATPAGVPRQDTLRAAVEATLSALDLDDARATYRAIAAANPGGLGRAPREDVRAEPGVDLRTAMRLAADRDSIARQYDTGFAEVFEAVDSLQSPGFSLMASEPGPVEQRHVLRLYLHWLARWPDSHIVRKHGLPVAHSVMAAAQAWRDRSEAAEPSELVEWDRALKARHINPGTSADLTVATLLAAALR